jgi:2-polyprenyl-3-methyl-5-hydroxy-6-metoxy-1,4-benzoquinol methylase
VSKSTRGFGLLEKLLAEMRYKVADKLIPSAYRKGRILDIGCGVYPFFLMKTEFSEKFGLDKAVQKNYIKRFQDNNIVLINYDIEKENVLPFKNEYFDVVTMLAVIEHFEPKRFLKMIREIYRVLKPGGMYILTTPAFWTDGLLWFMAKLRLLSPLEIEEHKAVYSHSKIFSMLREGNFSKEKIRLGYFEMFMNIWATATK